MTWRERIVVDPEICHGTPCIKGTRVPVSVVFDNLAAGEDRETIVREYPTLQSGDIDAAIAYAAEIVRRRKRL